MQEKIHPTVGVLVRSNGEVFVPANGRHIAHWTTGYDSGKGYLQVCIAGKHYYVHRLVLEAFVGPCPDGMECDHSDRNRRNNTLTNLRYVSRADNNRNTIKNDRVDARGGTHKYDNEKQYYREKNAQRRKTHKNIHFADGKRRYIPNAEALLLLAIPVSQRIYKG